MIAISEVARRRQPKQDRSEARLEQILQAAAEVMSEHNVPLTTMRMIAERANASIGTVYQYFPDKAAIVHALRTRYGKVAERTVSDLRERAN